MILKGRSRKRIAEEAEEETDELRPIRRVHDVHATFHGGVAWLQIVGVEGDVDEIREIADDRDGTQNQRDSGHAVTGFCRGQAGLQKDVNDKDRPK